eukprot:jgi/Psemu1/67909/estExt_Genemark1.C_3930026
METATRRIKREIICSNLIESESESEKVQWVSQLLKAQGYISSSSQKLEHAFKYFNTDFLQASGESPVPSSIKMIRRLTALEIAIGQLRQDCETISWKRNEIVKSVMTDQQTNVTQTEQISKMSLSPISSRKYAEQNELTRELESQLDLLSSTTI